ncbi:MAG: DUF1566 domain-containing protein [Desulfuromonadales bacterium]
MIPARIMILVVSGSLFLQCVAYAAEVSNLEVSFNDTVMTMEYRLTGKKGEKTSAVAVSVEVHGKQYLSGMLSLDGDFGEKVTVGSRKRIIWRYTEDVPKGLNAAFKCNVDAVPPPKLPREWESPLYGIREERFAVSRQAVTDVTTKLMWLKNAGYSARPLLRNDALQLITTLNARRYAGYNDWRLPSAPELEQLAASGRKNGWGERFSRYISDYFAHIGFLNVRSGSYLTSTMSSAPDDTVAVVSTWSGTLFELPKTQFYYLLPVRNIEP